MRTDGVRVQVTAAAARATLGRLLGHVVSRVQAEETTSSPWRRDHRDRIGGHAVRRRRDRGRNTCARRHRSPALVDVDGRHAANWRVRRAHHFIVDANGQIAFAWSAISPPGGGWSARAVVGRARAGTTAAGLPSPRDGCINCALAWSVWGLGALLLPDLAFYQRVAPAVVTDQLMVEFAIGGAALGNLSAFYFYSTWRYRFRPE